MSANLALLAPAAALVSWSLIVLFWMAARRVPAIKAAGLSMESVVPGSRGQDLERMAPGPAHWVAHNYSHLMEQPTLFYALAVILALAGGGPVDVILAWTYVVLRVSHSLWQGIVNTVPVRAMLFVLSSFILVAMAVRALMLTLGTPAA